MSADELQLIAEIRLLTAAEGGRTAPLRGSYRPNHNFFGASDAVMTVGVIDLPDGVTVDPGESITLPITLLAWPSLAAEIYPGREWRIQEGSKLVGFGRVIQMSD